MNEKHEQRKEAPKESASFRLSVKWKDLRSAKDEVYFYSEMKRKFTE